MDPGYAAGSRAPAHAAVCADRGLQAGFRNDPRQSWEAGMIPGFDAKKGVAAAEPLTVGHVPSGLEPFLLAELARTGQPVAYIMSDGQHMADIEQMLGFIAPDIPVLTLPAWDCLPYDRVSP